MKKKRTQFTPAFSSGNETLESRVVMAASALTGAAQIATATVHNPATHTTLAFSTGTLAQPTTFTVTVRAPASAGSPTGTVNISVRGQLLGTLNMVPSATVGKYAYSTATATLSPQPGGPAYFFGRHPVTAQFVPSGSTAKSSVNTSLNIIKPNFTTLAGGVKVATVAQGSGAAIQTGQTAAVFYTGYLAKNGQIFDDSLNDGGTPFTLTLGAGQVIPGFNTGTLGMQVGQTRIVEIPAAQGYGAKAQGSIPANSTLVFVLTLESIS